MHTAMFIVKCHEDSNILSNGSIKKNTCEFVWEGTQRHVSAQNVTGLINREKNSVIHVIKVWNHMISRWTKSIFWISKITSDKNSWQTRKGLSEFDK